MVFAGSVVLTTVVEVTNSVEGGTVTVGGVIVCVCSKEWTIVVAAGTSDADGAAAEPPSTATTE